MSCLSRFFFVSPLLDAWLVDPPWLLALSLSMGPRPGPGTQFVVPSTVSAARTHGHAEQRDDLFYFQRNGMLHCCPSCTVHAGHTIEEVRS